jgi:AcrR family transcriptional regulator
MKNMTQRQQQIIEEAIHIISEQGIQHLTMKTLAERIQVTEGAIYKHFACKDDILTGIAGQFKAISTQLLQDIISRQQAGLPVVRDFFISRLKQFSAHPGLAAVMFSEDTFKDNPALKEQIFSTMKEHRQLILHSLQEAIESKVLDKKLEPSHLFLIIMGSLRLLILHWLQAKPRFNLVEEGEKIWHTLEFLLNKHNNQEEFNETKNN